MPVYEYRCQTCGRTTDFLVPRIGGQPENPRCEHCGHEKLDRITSTVSCHAGPGGTRKDAGSCPTGGCPFVQS